MNLPFFENAYTNGGTSMPDLAYRQLQQAFVDDQWDNTVAMQEIEEQDRVNGGFDTFEFHPIEVWLDYVVGESSRGTKSSEDFASLIFRDLTYEMFKGRYYKFDNNFWISYFQNKFNGVTRAMAVRRCNNFMRIKDPLNGSLYTIPCVIDYDMASPANQVSQFIITPNNHATVMVQGNSYTKRLFKTNVRFIFSGRPFKLAGYQNALNNEYFEDDDTLLYLDLYLDEIHPEDDLVNQIADNGKYDYTVEIENKQDEVILEKGQTGKFYANVLLNGTEVERGVVWASDNEEVITVNQNGEYEIVGEAGQTAMVTVMIEGDTLNRDSIKIVVGAAETPATTIVIEPLFQVIREHEIIEFDVQAIFGGEYIIPDVISVDFSVSSKNLKVAKNGNHYTLTCVKRASAPVKLYVTVENSEPEFTITKEFEIKLVSLMG